MISTDFSRSRLIYYSLVSLFSISVSVWKLFSFLNVTIMTIALGMTISLIAFGMEILRNKKKRSTTSRSFFMSDLPNLAMLILIVVAILQDGVYEVIFILLIGIYAFVQAAAIAVTLYVYKMKIIREGDNTNKLSA